MGPYPWLSCGGAMEVAAWLKNLGLDLYEQMFIDNAIDADILSRRPRKI